MRFFFTDTIRNICKSNPYLFEGGDNGEDGQQQGSRRGFGQADFSIFGVIPFLLKYCEIANESLTDVMNEDIRSIFFIINYEMLKLKEQERMIKNLRK